MSDSLRPHEPQHARPPCPSPTPRAYPNSGPLSSLKGLGENAAKKIREAVTTGAATTVEELKTVAGLSKTLIETLRNAGCLKSMPESAQLSLFDL